MPELPEVEHHRRLLQREVGGCVIRRVHHTRRSVIPAASHRSFSRSVTRRRIREVARLGKYLLIMLDRLPGSGDPGPPPGPAGRTTRSSPRMRHGDQTVLVIHLRLSGKIVVGLASEPLRHECLSLELEDGRRVRIADPRRLARVEALAVDELAHHPTLARMGPDPTAASTTADTFEARLRSSHRPIKIALMDQHRIAGVGNIQATEALFRARIDPRTPAGRLTPARFRTLHRALRETLEWTLAQATATRGPLTYVQEAPDRNPFQVYGRAGEPCPNCGTLLDAVRLDGRQSVFCGPCQPPS